MATTFKKWTWQDFLQFDNLDGLAAEHNKIIDEMERFKIIAIREHCSKCKDFKDRTMKCDAALCKNFKKEMGIDQHQWKIADADEMERGFDAMDRLCKIQEQMDNQTKPRQIEMKCPYCESEDVEWQDTRSLENGFFEYRCKNCNHWFNGDDE